MAFEDLLLPNSVLVVSEYFPYVLGTTLSIPLDIEDTDGSLLGLSSGYTATMTLNLPDGSNALTFTQSLSGGRQIDLSASVERSLVIRSTVAGMSSLSAYVGRPLAFNLIVTKTAGGVAVDLMRECFIIPEPQHD